MHFRPRCVVCSYIHLRMETPLRGRSGGHTGTAPTVSFGWITSGWLVSFGQIARGMGDFVWVDCAWVVWFVLFVGKTVHMNQHHRCCTFVSPGLIERSEIYPG